MLYKEDAQAAITAFIEALGYNPGEVININISNLPTIDLSLQSTDEITGEVINRSERLSWQPIQTLTKDSEVKE